VAAIVVEVRWKVKVKVRVLLQGHRRSHFPLSLSRPLRTLRRVAKHIIIIGAGVIGLSTAYYALRKGHRVTVLERAPAARDGCSFGNAGMIVPSHFTPLAAPGWSRSGSAGCGIPSHLFTFDRGSIGT